MMRTTAVNVQSAISFFTLLFFLVISFPPSIAIKHSQDFLCLIVHFIKANESLHILIIRPPIIPIVIEITNICTKLRVVVYVM
ncbi:hypothetical protein BCE33L1662 [Bacillus cereus E33L]|uniref:Uncharacterized protein n=1 Tax=Bacillus cereus (strain ZK / E33L) TaxID=288681 RepID=Q63CW0_BACCZ|nr:hypothetical protein BCE33L1662 [Bacillus cereus E33L]